MSAFAGTLPERIVTLGNFVRGARLGFHWCSILQAMVRLSIEGDHFVVMMCPPNMIPSNKQSPPEHVCWWDTPSILGRSRAIVEHSHPVSLVRFAIDEHGEELR